MAGRPLRRARIALNNSGTNPELERYLSDARSSLDDALPYADADMASRIQQALELLSTPEYEMSKTRPFSGFPSRRKAR